MGDLLDVQRMLPGTVLEKTGTPALAHRGKEGTAAIIYLLVQMCPVPDTLPYVHRAPPPDTMRLGELTSNNRKPTEEGTIWLL